MITDLPDDTAAGAAIEALTDTQARHAIRTRLDANLFVEAGAGSGKTSSLVDRVVALVVQGTPISAIAAITFTEKAAEELRDRVRGELHAHAAHGDALCSTALEELDQAPIGTLHAFSQRLLREAPIEAGLPPRVEVLDDIRSEVAFDERWSVFRDRLLGDESLARTLLLLIAAGGKLDQIRELARAANASWDLVATRLQGLEAAEPVAVDRGPALRAARRIAAYREHCLMATDLLCVKLAEIGAWADRLESADELDALGMLAAGAPNKGNGGKSAHWPGPTVAEVKHEIGELGELAARSARDVVEGALTRIVVEVAQFTLAAAEERRSEGRLEFHDLLVLARALLRDPQHGVAVRARLRTKYRHLLLDEFQDTDPIQLEIAVLLGSREPGSPAASWQEYDADPGTLFFVGDPKQSIYRFRRADIRLFLEAQRHLVSDADRLALSSNFRTTPEILDWVNQAFGRLIQAESGTQPAYLALDPTRPPTPGDAGPSVMLCGVEAHPKAMSADAQRQVEAADVVAAIRTARHDGWRVRDDDPAPVAGSVDEHGERWRPLRLADICILIPARTSLGALEDALAEAGIPYRAETASLVYATREVRDLLMLLRAVDDPTDEAALVAALRTPWLGCGDDDLLEYRRGYGGRWDLRRDLPEALPADHVVRRAITFLRSLHDQRQWATASELLDLVVRERRVLELGFAMSRPRDLWRRVRFLVDQARAYEDAAGGDLRDFLRWTALQSAEGARVVEGVLPETDDDAVRIMTIHAAKGLEFPVVIVSGMTTLPRARRGVQLEFPPDRPFVAKLTKSVTSEGYEEAVAIDEQMDHHERLRLLYVACTRAQDHLVVSVHRRDGGHDDDRTRTNGDMIWNATADALGWVALEPAPRGGEAETAQLALALAPPIPFAQWEQEHAALVDPERAVRVVSASGLARAAAERAGQLTREVEDDDGRVEIVVDDPALDKEPRDLELPPWLKGRYGTAIGRAVHGVLQTIDLATGDGLADAVAAQAAAEGVFGFEERIEALARAAVRSDTVREAVTGRFWREIYVAVPGADGRLLEGYIDLLYERTDGLVVVDYKTDAVGSEADVDAKLDHYRWQGAAYAHAVAVATGRPVVECVFLFLTERGAIARALRDLDRAVAAVVGEMA